TLISAHIQKKHSILLPQLTATCHAAPLAKTFGVVPRLRDKGESPLTPQLRKGAWLPRSFTLSTTCHDVAAAKADQLSTLNSVKERGSHGALRSQPPTTCRAGALCKGG